MRQKNLQLEKIRHSLAHVMASAIQNIYGTGTSFGIGPVIENGFYYDIDFGRKVFGIDDAHKVEKEMLTIIARHLDFTKQEVSIAQAKKIFNHDRYKSDLITDIEKYGTTEITDKMSKETKSKKRKKPTKVTVYKTGDFVDLCRGPHVKNTKELSHVAFKIMRVAGAYWRGSEKNPMLTRIYGIAFQEKEQLKKHLHQLEEAEKRDHRKLGAELGIFMFDELVGKGLPLWLPNGTIIKNEIEYLAEELELADSYLRVSTPHVAKEELFKKSGHLPYYKDSMYPEMKMDDGTYYLKAMNCPAHHVIYTSQKRSYKDLPIRLAEYGTCYRNELSGTLAGLLRVRSLQMNDAHIYCRKDQIKEEVVKVIKLTQKYFSIFGFDNYWFRLSKCDLRHKDKYIHQPKNWKETESILRDLLKEMSVTFFEVKDEAAFYGPKIDIQFKSVVGREETLSTIQLDFLAKERFNLSYIDKNGKPNKEVFVIHRAPLSTHERFMAILIEHYAGAFPLWLAPVQVALVPVGKDHVQATMKLQRFIEQETSQLKRPVRISIMNSDETVGKKIQFAASQKIPFTIVIGDQEVTKNKKWIDSTQIIIRRFGSKETYKKTLSAFISDIQNLITKRLT